MHNRISQKAGYTAPQPLHLGEKHLKPIPVSCAVNQIGAALQKMVMRLCVGGECLTRFCHFPRGRALEGSSGN